MKIEDVISQRLKMQSTQKILENEFGITEFSKPNIYNFLSNIKTLPENKQKKFVATIGGPANFKKTLTLINNL